MHVCGYVCAKHQPNGCGREEGKRQGQKQNRMKQIGRHIKIVRSCYLCPIYLWPECDSSVKGTRLASCQPPSWYMLQSDSPDRERIHWPSPTMIMIHVAEQQSR